MSIYICMTKKPVYASLVAEVLIWISMESLKERTAAPVNDTLC